MTIYTTTGCDLSMNHGAIVTSFWSVHPGEYNFPTISLEGLPRVDKYTSKSVLGMMCNTKSDFPETIINFGFGLFKLLVSSGKTIWDKENLHFVGPVAIEWDQNMINFRGSRRKSTMVLGQALIALAHSIIEFDPGGYNVHFEKPSLTKLVLPDKIKKIEDLHAWDCPFRVNLGQKNNLQIDLDGDIFDAIALSYIALLRNLKLLDGWVDDTRQARKSANRVRAIARKKAKKEQLKKEKEAETK
ncbi:MAG: hypothetical protein JRE40_00360 [Deltaproteobacteria bacterium]|nr:hypothetical protein [Deltaproteobacteria bacterium]